MAFIHCHKCGWSQDDFWDFGWHKYGYWRGWKYNPFSLFLSYVSGYLKPRRIEHDEWCAEEHGWKRNDPHSWWLIWYEFKRMLRRFRTQKWWTYKSYEKSRNKSCPKCGNMNLCVD